VDERSRRSTLEIYTVLADAPSSSDLTGGGGCYATDAEGTSTSPGAALLSPYCWNLVRFGTAVRGEQLTRRLLAEFLGAAFLAAILIGLGIAAQSLSHGDVGLQPATSASSSSKTLQQLQEGCSPSP
jgi:hypothetical protein